MDNKITFKPATLEHAHMMAPKMRKADADEVWASCHYLPLDCLIYSVKHSQMAWTAFYDGEVICIFGLRPVTMLSDEAYVWMLGTDLIESEAKTFLRESKSWVRFMSGKYSRIFNYVDKRNKTAIRWLKWLGFTFEKDAKPYGKEGLPFYHFEMR